MVEFTRHPYFDCIAHQDEDFQDKFKIPQAIA